MSIFEALDFLNTLVDDSDPDIDLDQLQHLLQTAEAIRKDGHDEYLYHIMKDYLPEPALYMIRYHSFYAWHRECEYDWLCDDHDREILPWVRKFNPYDLYSKSPEPPDWKKLRPYYADLLGKYFPEKIAF